MLKMLITVAIMIPSLAYGYECNKEIDQISKEYDVKIVCKTKSIIDSNMDFIYEEAEQTLIDSATPAIKQFLSSYDKNILNLKLKTINCFKNITFLKSPVGGMNHSGHIWVTLDNYAEESASKIYQKILHHEFSSNIYKSVNFNMRLFWKNINYSYDYSISFLKKCLNNIKFCNATSEKLLTDGFLFNYSTTDDENDFNMFAETLFVDPKSIKFF